jgi:hypothetical protein
MAKGKTKETQVVSDKWERVGACPVDSGLIMIVDPCYVMPDRTDSDPVRGAGYDYNELLGELDKDANTDGPGYVDNHEIAFSKPYGTGIVVSNHIGDGVYPVEVRRGPDGGIVEARIRFE